MTAAQDRIYVTQTDDDDEENGKVVKVAKEGEEDYVVFHVVQIEVDNEAGTSGINNIHLCVVYHTNL